MVIRSCILSILFVHTFDTFVFHPETVGEVIATGSLVKGSAFNLHTTTSALASAVPLGQGVWHTAQRLGVAV